jgi:hypothetical protein
VKKKARVPKDKYTPELADFYNQLMSSLLDLLLESSIKGNFYVDFSISLKIIGKMVRRSQ